MYDARDRQITQNFPVPRTSNYTKLRKPLNHWHFKFQSNQFGRFIEVSGFRESQKVPRASAEIRLKMHKTQLNSQRDRALAELLKALSRS